MDSVDFHTRWRLPLEFAQFHGETPSSITMPYHSNFTSKLDISRILLIVPRKLRFCGQRSSLSLNRDLTLGEVTNVVIGVKNSRAKFRSVGYVTPIGVILEIGTNQNVLPGEGEEK